MLKMVDLAGSQFWSKRSKNKELSGDSRDPIHYWSLVEVVLDSPCGWSSGKIVAESCPEGCPLTFGPSKVRFFRIGEFDFDPSEVERASSTEVSDTQTLG